ncbi:ArsR/SmtB family transcription factor [Fusibacter tunisiensis]|uniref:ArsR family transcriptional regulator n=1 Tax=Fusibacter tunisiensis TaxID=1008308 RepID=A0ABS2MRJ2_9FIRM|nr:metalloregulator ArsR/SmtB family transcription factor [Fusibacter tunisiensis]MBM7562012.1 ArsR family transcriptional regulator [Fusibacter tunisiensis]
MDSHNFCNCTVIHEEIVTAVKEHLLPDDTAKSTAALFRVLGDPTRVRILQLLSLKEMCVCDISAALDMSQSSISHQLNTLRTNRLVRNRKAGKVVYYALDDQHVLNILNQGIDHISHKGDPSW